MISYAISVISNLIEMFIPTYLKTQIVLLTIWLTCSITSLIYFQYGLSLLEDKDFRSNISINNLGFISEFLATPFIASIICIKLYTYVDTNNLKKST